jgi:uroporphyrinogen decarboxylase
MRQAGRYLPEYRRLREGRDFLTLCKTPELAAEATVLPVKVLGVDAAILFSDIMVVPEAMGLELELVESRGPVLSPPVRSEADLDRLHVPDPEEELGFVLDAIRCTLERLEGEVPLIGFSGAPWTLFTYMVEGQGTKSFSRAKGMVYARPDLAYRLLEKITEAVGRYLEAQIRSGVHAVQIFDTWAGALPPALFREFSLAYLERLVLRLAPLGVPVILFAKDAGHSLERIAETGCTVVGIDWATPMGEAKKRLGTRVTLQGNLDPAILYAPPERIREGVREVLEGYGRGERHVFNLGHGILPDVPPDHVRLLVEAVARESPRFHRDGEGR